MRHVDLRLESESLPASVYVLRARGVEGLSRLFHFELEVVGGEGADASPEAFVGQPVALVFEGLEDELRRIHGIVVRAHRIYDVDQERACYRLEVAPRAWRLVHPRTFDVHLDLSIPEIIEKKLLEAGFDADRDFQMRLRHAYEQRDFVVQYGETDYDFIARLCEHHGIAFFFSDAEDREVLVFTDENDGFERVEGVEDAGLTQVQRRELILDFGEGGHITRLETESVTLPSRYVVRDYNYRSPHVDLSGAAPIPGGTLGEIVEYGPHARTPQECEHFARIRAQEVACGGTVYRGTSDVAQLDDGATFRVSGLPGRDDVHLLVVEITHELVQPLFERGDGEPRSYRNAFRAIPYGTPYRPPRTTPRPRVSGSLTGIVEGSRIPKLPVIDEQGRYLIRLLFDTAAEGERRASKPIRMAQPSAGSGYGMHFPLRPGVEVILTCINGDPDRPVITGAVPNQVTRSPVFAENLERNVIETRSGIKIEFVDGA